MDDVTPPPRAFLDGRVVLYHGDNRDVLRSLPDNSIDSIVTDPPYALVSIVKRFGKQGSAAAKPEGMGGAYNRLSGGFMGKSWDTGEVAFAIEFWAECFRVLKPGGHVVAFSGTRTVHRMVCAIEDAGFEIRDLLAWMFGTGFPKSHDVSKAIDRRKDWSALPKLQGAIKAAREELGISQSEAARRVGLIGPDEKLGGGGYMWFETGMRMPTREQWPRLKDSLKLSDEFDACFDEAEREVTGTHEQWTDRANYAITSKDGLRRDKPASELAAQWQGWGSALKPALEPICLARKPMIGTTAENVLAHGTGAINIDACRVGQREKPKITDPKQTSNTYGSIDVPGGKLLPDARWPANVLHDGSDEVLAAFPDSNGARGEVRGTEASETGQNGIYNRFARVESGPIRGDEGSAARFFFSAKADASDRLGSKHPTVKPVGLMQWLCRLITPRGGTVLDPFAGTGPTGEAAWREGMRAILIEREAEYVEDIARRLDLADKPTKRDAVAKTKNNLERPEDLPLFATLKPEAAE